MLGVHLYWGIVLEQILDVEKKLWLLLSRTSISWWSGWSVWSLCFAISFYRQLVELISQCLELDWVLDVRHRLALLSISGRMDTLLRLVSARLFCWVVRSLLLLGFGDHNIVSHTFLFRTPVIWLSLIVHHCTLAMNPWSRVDSLIQEILTAILVIIVLGSFCLAFRITWSQSWIVGFLIISSTTTVIFVLVSSLKRTAKLVVEICHRFLCFLFFIIKLFVSWAKITGLILLKIRWCLNRIISYYILCIFYSKSWRN